MPIRLLLADDSITIHKVVNLTFAAEDVSIESVTQGDVAIERARETRPDIVLADVFMPGRNGYEVCAAIKEDPRLEGTPVVLLVGTFEPFDELEASRAKCDAYLTKPFDTSELIEIVHSLVERRGVEEQEAESGALLQEKKALRGLAEVAGAPSTLAGLISDKTRESFLGSNRILDLFDSSVLQTKAAAHAQSGPADPMEAASSGGLAAAEESKLRSSTTAPHVIPFPGTRGGGSEPFPIALTDEVVDMIVEKVVKRMSQEVVREIAWEVVPELSQIMIRQYIDELKAPHKT
jgi:CheY-like chemotaxis protein